MTTATLTGPRAWLEAVLGFVYPQACQICGDAHATPDEGFICTGCRREIQFVQPPYCARCGLPYPGEITNTFECSNCREMKLHFCHARSAIEANSLALEIIHRYKYQRALWFEPLLAELLIREAAPVLRAAKWDFLVPVPLHPAKEAEREFNQAERLARRLGQAAGIAVNTRLLRRILPTRTQTKLSREERAENVRRAFTPVPGADCKGKRVIVFDDVLTTGATTNACARALKACGAAEVCVWTLARGLLR
jgi:ComF family protein